MDPLSLVIPYRCLSCRRRIAMAGLCTPCLTRTPTDRRTYQVRPGIAMTAIYHYRSPVGDAIRFVKAMGSLEGAAYLASLLGDEIAAIPTHQRTYIPSTWVRTRRRGLDLPQWLAGPGARRLFMRSPAPRQDGYDLAHRLTNPQRSIHLAPILEYSGQVVHSLKGYRPQPLAWAAIPADVFIIDDVRTTGATGVAAAQLLVDQGYCVHVITLAGGGKPAGQLADVHRTHG